MKVSALRDKLGTYDDDREVILVDGEVDLRIDSIDDDGFSKVYIIIGGLASE